MKGRHTGKHGQAHGRAAGFEGARWGVSAGLWPFAGARVSSPAGVEGKDDSCPINGRRPANRRVHASAGLLAQTWKCACGMQSLLRLSLLYSADGN